MNTLVQVMGSVIARKDEPMLVMEFMEYGSLYDLLHNETIMVDGELIFPILQDIARGARFLHAADPKIIHGDLKAANVLVDGRFRAKIADFGLSGKKKCLGATGTPYWMAPELLRRESGNSAESDVYLTRQTTRQPRKSFPLQCHLSVIYIISTVLTRLWRGCSVDPL